LLRSIQTQFIEFGAGKAQLCYRIATAITEMHVNDSNNAPQQYLVIDRAGNRTFFIEIILLFLLKHQDPDKNTTTKHEMKTLH
jgi:hypothetical protein